MLSSLVHGHLCEHVSVVVCGRLVGQDVRHAHQRTTAETSLNLFFNLISDAANVFRRQLIFRKLVQSLLKVRHGDHPAQRHDLIRVLLSNISFNQLPRNDVALAILRVSRLPRSVFAQGVEKH